jgi:hypothetical protein
MKRASLLASLVAFVLLVASVVLASVAHDPASVVGAVFYAAFPVVGLVITRHQPRNSVGWCFLVSPILLGIEKVGDEATALGLRRHWASGITHLAAWAQAWAWFPGLFVLITVGLLRFPNGRLLGARWRWVERASYLAMGVWIVGLGVVAALIPSNELASSQAPHPRGWKAVVFAIAEAMFFVIIVCVLASLGSLVLRYRRGGVIEREQSRWVLSAAVIAIVIEIGLDVSGSFVSGTPDWVQTLGEGIGFALIAIATGVAITRYKLYEIERIVSRTVSYAVVLVVLAGIYVGILVALTGLVPADLGQVGVAAATLLVSIVAVPLTRRVRRVVDRRFDRSRFDAEGVASAFAARLRARPERGDVPTDLLTVVQRTVAPAHASVWMMPTSNDASLPI